MKTLTTIDSEDGQTKLNLVCWPIAPQKKPKAILQIVHGMAEYIERYQSFALFLNTFDIVVIGHDHLGHGRSISNDASLGFFQAGTDYQLLVKDTIKVTTWIKTHYEDVPLFIMGHSMGSFVVRNFLQLGANQVQGAIIMGTADYRPELPLLFPYLAYLNKREPHKQNQLIDQLAFGNFNRSFPEKDSPHTWLSANQANVMEYEQHPKLGFLFTNNGFYHLFHLMHQATKTNWYEPIPRNLPLLIISGQQDPVGNFGKGPQKIARSLADADFTNITLQLYDELRHEILNEATQQKQMVMHDIYRWIAKQIKKTGDTL